MTPVADPAFSLLPLDETITEPAAALEAAAESVLDDPFASTEEKDPPIPFGRSWAFDYDIGRLVRSAGSPAEVRGISALIEYLQTSMRTAAGVHPILPANFGIQNPEDFLGVADPTEALSDFLDRARTAFLAHDRILDVREFEADVDLAQGIIFVSKLTIVTDQSETIPLGPFQVEPEAT